jgi:hypothetical protein
MKYHPPSASAYPVHVFLKSAVLALLSKAFFSTIAYGQNHHSFVQLWAHHFIDLRLDPELEL